jgi:hypothetical protein
MSTTDADGLVIAMPPFRLLSNGQDVAKAVSCCDVILLCYLKLSAITGVARMKSGI